ncbi:hypothetical protein CYLTODRAFT_448288 [Cylindrobasidium torrendii FP15055 ss-10]|uniref:ER membrane protein complex subunit 10 n=1 Tax=Cylindrobasidium torrendii FP15055 ss-10 TaxID=1314674 RepID=A0A0D7BU67_9AGAR|nr:hypothetical protein CYLTODRAFT_448288 [Cylindrobasidium torrendii FP15055 ss-10]
MLRAATLLYCSLAVLAVDVVDIYHRVSHPDLPQSKFQLRGQVTLDSLPPALVASASSASDLSAFTEALGTYSSDPRTLYQIALGSSFEQISSVRYCHLGPKSSESIVLRSSISAPTAYYALDYFVTPIPHDGSCPSPLSVPTIAFESTNVTIQTAHFPPLPELRGQPVQAAAAQQVGEDGSPKPVPEEKTFLQKYWLYIAAALVMLTFSPAPMPDEPGGARRPVAPSS